MPTQFEKYRFTKRTVLSDETFNKIWQDIDLRITALEDIKKDWQGAVDTVTRYGLVRIEEVLRPSWEYIEQKKAQADNIVAEIQDLRESADEIINANRDDAVEAVNSVKNDALSSINSVKNDALSSIEQAKQQAINQLDLNNIYAMTFFFGGD